MGGSEPAGGDGPDSRLTDRGADFLSHYGIKGMKWGVRRKHPSASHPPSEDHAKATASKEKIKAAGGTHPLSNQELQHLVNRMNLEKQYSTLSTQTKKKNPAGKFVGDMLLNIGKQQAQNYANDQIKNALKKKAIGA